MTLKTIAQYISLEKIMELLAWKIHKIHNLRESHITDCSICYHYFTLDEELKKLKENGGIHLSGCIQSEPKVNRAPQNLGAVNDTVYKTQNYGQIENCHCMSFGQAFDQLKNGKKITRSGRKWFIYLNPELRYKIRRYIPGLPENEVGIHSDFDIYIELSQEDMLANDWIVLES
ncbi:MAG: DUF2829 domain-containing protein [Atribacterota bacterium]|nr:DUF2829 domain-containing protein [Atribacterota bacterium]